jgi:hypothetical protein
MPNAIICFMKTAPDINMTNDEAFTMATSTHIGLYKFYKEQDDLELN